MSESALPKVLIITYYWPPSGGAGVQRWLKTVKYLRQYGWEPVIYTPSNPESPSLDNSLQKDIPDGLEVIRRPIWEPYLLYKKFVGLKKDDRINAGFLSEKKKAGVAEKISVWLRGNLFIPDARKFWIKPSIRFLTSYLKKHKVDAIVSTGPPHSMHLIAMELSRKLSIPWLADFRDPWTEIDFYQDLKLSDFADAKHRRLEKKVLKSASSISVVSKSMAEGFRKIVDREYCIIPNGYDHEDFLETSPIELDSHFSLAHIGSLVPARNPQLLWKALSELANKNPEFSALLEIKLVGKVDHSVLDDLAKYGLTNNLRKIDYLMHDKVLAEMQKSQVLLLLINQTQNSRGILTGKIFEYLATGRPILCIGPRDGDAAEVILQTGAGVIVDFDDEKGLRAEIKRFYQAFRENGLGKLSSNAETYSRKQLTAKIAETLDRLRS